jgi:hypothetical protein
MFKKSKGKPAAGGSGVRCTGCKGSGWVEFAITKDRPERDANCDLTGREIRTVGRTNQKCGNCDGTGWV